MVIRQYLLALALLLALGTTRCAFGQESSASAPSSGTSAVPKALSQQRLPWYDSSSDTIKPVKLKVYPPPSPSPGNVNFSWLPKLAWIVTLTVGAILFVLLLVWFWKIYKPIEPTKEAEKAEPGKPRLVEALPEGMIEAIDLSDPLGEATRRRNRGDYQGALACLFAHQLLRLSAAGMIRLAPGRTGRQLVRSISDTSLRSLVQPTLRLFESSYYGRKPVLADEFEYAWNKANEFEQRMNLEARK